MLQTTVPPLTPAELTKKDGLETIVAKGIESFREVGSALIEINDAKLWRAEYVSFADYLKDKWGISQGRGYQLINASLVANDVSTIVEIKNEATARELDGMTKEEQIAAAHKLAALGRAPTAKDARKAAAQVSPKKMKQLQAKKEREEKRLAKKAKIEAAKREAKEKAIAKKEAEAAKKKEADDAKAAKEAAREAVRAGKSVKAVAEAIARPAKGGLAASIKDAPAGKPLKDTWQFIGPAKFIENWYEKEEKSLNSHPMATPAQMVKRIIALFK